MGELQAPDRDRLALWAGLAIITVATSGMLRATDTLSHSVSVPAGILAAAASLWGIARTIRSLRLSALADSSAQSDSFDDVEDDVADESDGDDH